MSAAWSRVSVDVQARSPRHRGPAVFSKPLYQWRSQESTVCESNCRDVCYPTLRFINLPATKCMLYKTQSFEIKTLNQPIVPAYPTNQPGNPWFVAQSLTWISWFSTLAGQSQRPSDKDHLDQLHQTTLGALATSWGLTTARLESQPAIDVAGDMSKIRSYRLG